MLRLWVNQAQIKFSKDALVINQPLNLSFMRSTISQRTIEIGAKTLLSSNDVQELLSNALQNLDLKSGRLSIYLSSEFVRFAMIPGLHRALTAVEQQRVTQTTFERIYGRAAKDWVCQSVNFTYKKPAFAAAIDQSLLDGFNHIASKRQFKLIAVKPTILQLYDSLIRKIPNKPSWLIIVENTSLVILGIQNKKITTCNHSFISAPDLAIEMLLAFKRETLCRGEADNLREIFLCAPTIIKIPTEYSYLKINRLPIPVMITSNSFLKPRSIQPTDGK